MIYENEQFKATPVDFVKALQDLLTEEIAKVEVDYDALESYEYSANPYECDYDEDEAYRFQLEQFTQYVEADGWGEYLPIKGTRWWNEYINNTPAYQRVQQLVLNLLVKEF